MEKLTQSGLKVRPKTIKLLEESIKEKHNDIGFGYDFLYLNTKSTGGKKSKNWQMRLH